MLLKAFLRLSSSNRTLRFSWVLYHLFLTKGGASVWLSAPDSPWTLLPPIPRFTPSALKYVQLSRCAITGSCLFSRLLLCFPTHHHDGASQEHLGNLLLSPQMKGRTPRGAGRPGRLTNHICPTGAASQVRMMQRWLVADLPSHSVVRFYFYSPDATLLNILGEESNCLKLFFF